MATRTPPPEPGADATAFDAWRWRELIRVRDETLQSCREIAAGPDLFGRPRPQARQERMVREIVRYNLVAAVAELERME